MVHPYLRRRNGRGAGRRIPTRRSAQVLEKTLGVPLFQEQAMRLAVVAAGFTPGEADQLRRAMGAWRRPGLIDQFRQKLIDGHARAGASPSEYAEAVFRQIRGFGDYGFPESHAASFALLVYVSAWLKHHHPAAFTAALLNSQPMGFYAPAQLVRNAREHGVEVRPVDVNSSRWDCTLEEEEKPTTDNRGATSEASRTRREGERRREGDGESYLFLRCRLPLRLSAPQSSELTLRLGFRMLNGMSEAHAGQIVRARGKKPLSLPGRFFFSDRFGSGGRCPAGQGRSVRLARAGPSQGALACPGPGPEGNAAVRS